MTELSSHYKVVSSCTTRVNQLSESEASKWKLCYQIL